MDKIKSIQDFSIRKLYTHDIKVRERDLYRRKTVRTWKNNIRPAISVRKKLEKIFIVTIINHPYIMDKVVENFVKIEFDDFYMCELKKRILENYSRYVVDNDSEKYTVSMRNIEVDTKDITLHAGFSRLSVSDEEALEGWLKLWNRYNIDPLIMADLQMASSNLKSTFSENDWQRLKTLKKESIHNKTKEQEI